MKTSRGVGGAMCSLRHSLGLGESMKTTQLKLPCGTGVEAGAGGDQMSKPQDRSAGLPGTPGFPPLPQ